MAVADPEPRSSPVGAGPLAWPGGLLGFSLGGFFDGILLHQVLQWHHLLSGLEGAAFSDLRLQIMADGLFHILMYAVAIAGLWMLWFRRGEFAAPRADTVAIAWLLIGFGLWHVIDAILSHWLLGLHRIRMDTEWPLFWDLLWFLVFGVAFMAAGFRLLRRGGGSSSPGRIRRHVAPAMLGIITLTAGPLSALPPADTDTAMVLFRPDVTTEQAMTAVAAAGGRAIWHDPSGQLWAVDLADAGAAIAFYRHGAWLVGSRLLPAGCLGWSRL